MSRERKEASMAEKEQSDIRKLDAQDVRQVGGMGMSEPDEGPEGETRPWEPPKPELGPNEKPIESTLTEADDTKRDPSDAPTRNPDIEIPPS
jgi:hypothetical protein